MNKIKSENAIKYLNRCFLAGNTKESISHKAYNRNMCEEALIRCESDARDRAVRAFCKQCQQDNDGCPSDENLKGDFNNCNGIKQFKQAYDYE